MNEELIIVRQLPVIEQHLRELSAEVDKNVEAAMSLVCTEETVKSVKKTRADLNRQFTALEEQRKAVKTAIMGPYEQFQKVYDECVAMKFRAADTALKGKIAETEGVVKDRKEEAVRLYYIEKAASLNISGIPFERAGLNITISASEKSLKSACDTFLAGIAEGLSMIETQEYRDEIMVEFRASLNAAQAVKAVADRHQRMEEEKERAALREQLEKEARERAQSVKAETSAQEVLASPTAEPDMTSETVVRETVEEPVYRVKFTAIGTKSKLVALKEFMRREGIRYE